LARKALSEVQSNVLSEVEARLAQAHRDARSRLSAAGLGAEENLEPHFECLLCGCDEFTIRRGAARCASPGCDHSLFSHNVPI
jgi:hypothetical protein